MFQLVRSLLLISLFWVLLGKAQQITVTDVQAMGDSVRVSYQISDEDPDRSYDVRAYLVTDEDTLRLTHILGDIGVEMLSGSYSFLWDAIGQMGRYRGTVSIRMEAYPSFSIQSPEVGAVAKKGKPFVIQWFGSNTDQDELLLELYAYDDLMDTIQLVRNANSYTWVVPDGMTPGKGYRVKITGTEVSGVNEFSPMFKMKGKFPIIWVIVPAALLIGGAAAFFLIPDKSPSPTALPGPPDPD